MNETKYENNGDNKKSVSSKQSLNFNWPGVLYYIYIHVIGISSIYVLFTSAKWLTLFYLVFLVAITSVGLTVGAHRLYAHQTFTASWQLRFFLVLMHTLAGVGSLYDWVFWHRVHHKYYGTDKDPYNHKKGFFYSHMLSNLMAAPSDIKTYQKDIDMRDVDADGFVWIQRKFYWILFIIFGLLLPMNVPLEYWNESFLNTFLVIGITRLMLTTNIAWLVNSALLIWGLKKGDKFPIDDNSVFFLSKSYWLNYHYLVSWDWKNDEFGSYDKGFATFVIKMFYELGLLNEMKTTTSKDVQEILHKVASKELTLQEAIETLKEKATEDACKQKLIYYH